MKDGWSETPFSSVLSSPVRNGIYKKKEFHGSGVKIVNMGELFANPRLGAIPMRRVNLSKSEQRRFSVQAGDLIFARRSLVAEGAGRCCVILETDELTAFESSIIRARPDPTISDSLFLYYYFNSPQGLHSLDTIRRQVAVAGITGTDLSQLPVPLPALPEQRAIANILGTLDDKIELNRRMNQTLEAMASAIFQDWFVDFGPVRAKMEGQEPYLPTELWDLFPDELVDSEVGEIPEKWSLRNFGDLLDDVIGGDWGKEFPDPTNTEPVAIIRGTDIPSLRTGSRGSVPTRFTSEKKAERRKLQDGDIVIEVSGGSPTTPTGRSMIVTTDILERFNGTVVCASFCRRLRPSTWTEGMIASQHLDYLNSIGKMWEYQLQSTGISNFQTKRFELLSNLVEIPFQANCRSVRRSRHPVDLATL